jgi:phosphoserine aminotransferase
MLILSPRAVQRLESHAPPWPLPKIFRLTKGGKLVEGVFQGATINTPSMLCVADYLDALDWVRRIGGLAETIRRSERNLAVIEAFVAGHPWIRFLAREPAQRSNTSVCLTLDCRTGQKRWSACSREGVAHDVAPTGMPRPVCGSGAAPPWRRERSAQADAVAGMGLPRGEQGVTPICTA